ncbi:unnamed protein product, partial [Ectocarpus sp. 13 AM-2016]
KGGRGLGFARSLHCLPSSLQDSRSSLRVRVRTAALVGRREDSRSRLVPAGARDRRFLASDRVSPPSPRSLPRLPPSPSCLFSAARAAAAAAAAAEEEESKRFSRSTLRLCRAPSSFSALADRSLCCRSSGLPAPAPAPPPPSRESAACDAAGTEKNPCAASTAASTVAGTPFAP